MLNILLLLVAGLAGLTEVAVAGLVVIEKEHLRH
jgi:hypothetical protein